MRSDSRGKGLRTAVAAALVVLGLVGAAQETAPPDETEPPAPDEVPIAAPRYRVPAEGDRLVSSWMGTGLAERIDLGATSAAGREVLVVQFGAPGERPLAERRTVLLVGGLDGVSIAGSEAVVSIVESLLAAPDMLPADVAFLAIPWANPDGLERWLTHGTGAGRNGRPTDDDGDGRVDEDGAEDVDGDGQVLEMLVEDPRGPWARTTCGRFLRPAREGEAPRYQRVREGRDDDGDGRYNEDGPGGVALDHNFPLDWEGPWSGEASGPWPLSEPCSRALADLMLSRRLVVALFFQGNHGQLVAPGGRDETRTSTGPVLGTDGPAFQTLVDTFTRATGRPPGIPVRLREARSKDTPGSPVDWAYTALGALAMEVGVWGPEVERRRRGNGAPGVREGTMRRDLGLAPEDEVDVTAADRAWTTWLDETRGGIGFVEWQPLDLGDGRTALIGGWEPRTRINPPPDALPQALHGLDTFVGEVAQSLARLEVEVSAVEREGLLVRLRARVKNNGRLPSGVGPTDPRDPGRLTLELAEGMALVAGAASVWYGHVPGGAAGGEVEWLFTAPAGAVVRLHIASPHCEDRVKEVRLP